MLAARAWSLLAKLLLHNTQEGHVSLHITATGDLVLKPADSALRVCSGAVVGCCLHNGVVLFKVNGVSTRLCDWNAPALPFTVVCPRTNVQLYETSDAWAQQCATIMDSIAVPAISPFAHAHEHVAALTHADVTAETLLLLVQVFPSLSRLVPNEGTWCGPLSEVVQGSDAVVRALQAEMEQCDDELLCVAIQAIGQRLGCTLAIPARAINTTDSVMQTLPMVVKYEDVSYPMPVAKYRAYLGAHNFDITQASIVQEKDADMQYKMRMCARTRGGIRCESVHVVPDFSMCVEGQSTTEVQPGDCVNIEHVALGRTIQVWNGRGECEHCLIGPCGVFRPAEEGIYTVNGRQLTVAYNTAKISVWCLETNETFSRISVKPGDADMSVIAVAATRWRFCNDVYAMFGGVRVELESIELGVYAVRSFPTQIWQNVCDSDSGTTMVVTVHYGRLSTAPVSMDISAALRNCSRPADVGATVFGPFADLFPHIEPQYLHRAAVVCSNKLWTQPDVCLTSAGLPACGETTALWLMSECEMSVDMCTFMVPGTMEALRQNKAALPCVSVETTDSVCQLVGHVKLELPQFNPVHVSETGMQHDLGGTVLKWSDGFYVLVMHCGLHLCSKPARHEQLILTDSDAQVVEVQVTDPTPTQVVRLSSVGCFAWIVQQTVYVYNVASGVGNAWVVPGICSEPVHPSTLVLDPYPHFTRLPASLPLTGEMHEICSVWGTGFRGVDLLNDRLNGLVPPYTDALTLVLHPMCNSRCPCGLVPMPVQHSLHSSIFQAFGYNPDQYVPWTVAAAYESVWQADCMQTVLRRALCGSSASLLQCMNLQLVNPYPGSVVMQMRVPSSVLIAHDSEWVDVGLKGCVDGTDVLLKGACITQDGALFVAITGLSSEYNNSILLQEIPTSLTVPAAVLLVLRCFLEDSPLNITLPATLKQKRVNAAAASLTHLDCESDD